VYIASAPKKEWGFSMSNELFEPAAYLLGTRSIPSSAIFYVISGGAEKHLRIHLDLSQPASTFVKQALAVVNHTAHVRFHGRPTGFVVVYSPTHSVRYDLRGKVLEVMKYAYQPPLVTIELEGGEE
jgi:hypothetical protein